MPEKGIGVRGERLIRLRDKLGLNQMEGAYRCHVNQGNLSRIEREDLKNPTLDTLARLADGYQTTIEYLIGATNDPAPRHQSALDRLSDDEAQMLLTYQELLPEGRAAVLSLARSIVGMQPRPSDDPPAAPPPIARRE